MSKYLFLIFLICFIKGNLHAQLTNEERSALHKKEAALSKAIDEQFPIKSFTLNVNTKHPDGFYFNSYFTIKIKQVIAEQLNFYIEWEEIIGAAKTGDLELTKYTLSLNLSSLESFEAVVSSFQPNSGDNNYANYASLKLNTGNRNSILLFKDKYEIDKGIKTKIESKSGHVNEVLVPLEVLENCTTCTVTESIRKVLRAFNDVSDYYESN